MSKDQDKVQEQEEKVQNTQAEAQNDEVADKKEETTESQEPSLEEQLAESNAKFIRLYAEFENFRKRTNKEKVDLISTASAGVLKDLLTVLDDFERAIQNNENVEDATALKEGFQLIYNKFKTILEGKGLKPMEAKGGDFDSEIHEAIANIPAPTNELKGKIVDDVEKGYYLNDKVIRFAKVVVGQ